MHYAAFQELKTSRLWLRKMKMEDAQLYYERLGSSEAVTKHMLFQLHKDISESVASVQKHLRRYETGNNYRWVIALQATGELIGVIDLLRFDEDMQSCSFAYMLGEAFWGRGFGTEALEAVIDFAFAQMEMETVEADHFGENVGSGAVMKKVGMTCTGVILGKYEKDGISHDAPQYVITRQQWLAKKNPAP